MNTLFSISTVTDEATENKWTRFRNGIYVSELGSKGASHVTIASNFKFHYGENCRNVTSYYRPEVPTHTREISGLVMSGFLANVLVCSHFGSYFEDEFHQPRIDFEECPKMLFMLSKVVIETMKKINWLILALKRLARGLWLRTIRWSTQS